MIRRRAPVRVGRGILAHVGCPGRPSQLTFFQVKLQQCLAPACAPGGVKIPGAVTSPSSVTARAAELPRSRYRRRGMNATFRRSFARADPRRPSRLTFSQVKLRRCLARRAWGWARRLIPEQSHRHPHGQSHGAVAPVLWTKRPLSMLRLFLSHASSEECRRVGKWEEGRRVGKWRSIE